MVPYCNHTSMIEEKVKFQQKAKHEPDIWLRSIRIIVKQKRSSCGLQSRTSLGASKLDTFLKIASMMNMVKGATVSII